MEIVVISPETSFPNEHAWMVKLFDGGLSHYHVRKPGMNESALEAYLAKVPAEWHSKLVMHQGHPFVRTYNLGGWHFKDDAVQIAEAKNLLDSRESGKVLSRSIHSLSDLNENLQGWDYVFLSPVYTSISKRGYGPSWEEFQLTAALRHFRETHDTQVFGLGGIDDSRVRHCLQMGFDGVALLGAVWHSRNPLRSFLRAREALTLSINR